jgi:outer membrane protein assembly factor BamB
MGAGRAVIIDRRHMLLAGAGLCLASAARARPALPGDAPAYDTRDLTAVPNAAAIGRRYWSPGLNEGYVPQGLTVFGDEILIAAYRSTERDQDNGPARVFRLARGDGRLLGSFALPATYGHPGGLATARGTLFVANSGRLLALDFKESCRTGECAPLKEVRIDKAMGPSFLAASGDALWFGPYRREGAPNLHAVPIERILAGGEAPVGLGDSRAILPLPLFAQGATFDKAGKVWISQSSGNRPAFLSQLDPATGAVLARYPAPGGIEDLGLAPDGRLWAVGEAGTQRWNRWSTFYPLVFEIDPAKLVA